ncbi:Protein ZGRF1 [Bienertia sinuspersici]
MMCYHDEVAPLKVVKYNGPTMGERFYTCAYWPVKIAELEMEKELLEGKMNSLKETVEELAIENTEIRQGVYEAKTDRKLVNALVLYWIFFCN